jgi:hypothetical protein
VSLCVLLKVCSFQPVFNVFRSKTFTCEISLIFAVFSILRSASSQKSERNTTKNIMLMHRLYSCGVYVSFVVMTRRIAFRIFLVKLTAGCSCTDLFLSHQNIFVEIQSYVRHHHKSHFLLPPKTNSTGQDWQIWRPLMFTHKARTERDWNMPYH